MNLRLASALRLSPARITAVLLALGGVVYVGNTWSPSSYALVLRLFQAPDDGLSVGAARPIRSDEFAVVTPLTQAAVNNGFDRTNRTSLYGEDLRTTYELPLLDWGLAFKPTMWLYPLVNAAYAFSFHHYALIALFLLGYTLLFQRLGAKPIHAPLLSAAVFFTGFAQYWWTTFGPLLALFPWVLLVVLSRWALPWRTVALYWVATCWLLSAFYPPLFISLAFLAVVLLLAFRPDVLELRTLLAYGAASAAAGLTSVLYLKDWLLTTRTTLYPGQRRVGGGGYGLDHTLSQLFPTANVQAHENLLPYGNVCELATVGSFYVLLVLCFLQFRNLRTLDGQRRRQLAVLLAGNLLLSAWLYLPLPSWAGAPLLWNFVPPTRMAFVAGFLWLILAYVLAESAGLRVTLTRTAVFCAAVVGGWVAFKYVPHGIGVKRAWKDLIVLLPAAGLLPVALRGWLTPERVQRSVLASCAVVAFLSFGSFNPLQRAWPIFNRPHTPVTEQLDSLAKATPGGVVVETGFPGATLNGWGYKSASHVLTAPQLPRFRAMFPEMSEDAFNSVFNRYAHLVLTDEWLPRLIQADALALPMRAFVPAGVEQRFSEVEPELIADPDRGGGGFVDRARVENGELVLTGWAPWQGVSATQGLEVHANVGVDPVAIQPMPRPDVARLLGAPYLLSGFRLELKLTSGKPVAPGDLAVCLLAVDRKAGTAVRLQNPPGLRGCAAK